MIEVMFFLFPPIARHLPCKRIPEVLVLLAACERHE